jgi:hypothetical protein
MKLGKLIRRFDLATLQSRSNECASACALAFLGGVKRIAEPGSIGVHKTFLGEGSGLSEHEAFSISQDLTADMLAYLREMGVDSAFLEFAYKYEGDDIRYLSGSEMQVLGVTNVSQVTEAKSLPAEERLALPPSFSSMPKLEQQPKQTQVIYSGQVRHPKGQAPVKALAEGSSPTLGNLRNGTSIEIIGDQERWYKVRLGSDTGYMHDTWIRVQEYPGAGFEDRFLQIKSFDNERDAVRYARTFSMPANVFEATNGWYAVTLKGVAGLDEATAIKNNLKELQLIPSDAFVTYGNTYKRFVCCE